MSYLFNREKIRKVFDILKKQGRCTNNRYLNWDKTNPHIGYCEKQVFIKRVSGKILPSRYIKLYNIENKTISFLYILSIKYYLGYAEDLEFYYLDLSKTDLGIQSKKIGWNDLISFEGVFCENADEHNKVLNMFKLDLPTKTYRFLAYDFDKYPKRVRKGTDPKEKMKTYVDVEAISTEDALNKRKDINSKLMITEEFQTL